MTKFQLSAVSLIIITTAGLTIFNLSNDDDNLAVKALTTEQSQSEISTLQDDRSAVNVARIDRSALPVVHGIADENGQQIHAEDQPRRLPPPVSVPDNQDNKRQNLNASQHGHEQSYSTEHENTAPPPVGANK